MNHELHRKQFDSKDIVAKSKMRKTGMTGHKRGANSRILCLWNTKSGNKVSAQCPPNYTGMYAHEHNCHLFYACWHGRSSLQACALGTAFDNATLECTHEHLVSSCAKRGRDESHNVHQSCSLTVAGSVQASERNCSQFSRCVNGQRVFFDCPPGTRFDKKQALCDHAHKVKCDWPAYENKTSSADVIEVAESKTACFENEFLCDSTKCLSNEQICDGKPDCLDGTDESECAQFLKLFTHKNDTLQTAGIRESWTSISLNACAKLCAQSNEFECKSINYKIMNGVCDLSDSESTQTLMEAVGFSYYWRRRGGAKYVHEHEHESESESRALGTANETYCTDDYWTCSSRDECILYRFVCDGSEDCYDGSDENHRMCAAKFRVRLVNGTESSNGRVEIRHNGIWGTVCDDNFDENAAAVVCRQLGFGGRGVVKKAAYFGNGRGPIWLDQLVCDGTERSVVECLRGKWAVHNCQHDEDVGVDCGGTVPGAHANSAKNATLRKTQCGMRAFKWAYPESQFRVVAAPRAHIGDYPYQASIRVRKLNDSFHWCGGVLISERFVLTSAHCLQAFGVHAYVVRVGDSNMEVREPYEFETFVERVFVHEQFRANGVKDHDIALVQLKKPVPVSEFVSPICLPRSSALHKPYMNCTVAGFGSGGSVLDGNLVTNNELRSAWIPILPDKLCRSQQLYGYEIGSGMFCAGFVEGGVDTCEGDSGGPLACLIDGHFTLMGITSWGKSCGKRNRPGVYVKVADYVKWIESKMQAATSPQP